MCKGRYRPEGWLGIGKNGAMPEPGSGQFVLMACCTSEEVVPLSLY